LLQLFKAFGDLDEIAVYETAELYGEKGTFRILQFSDGAMQGAMDLNRPERIVFEYPRAIIHLMEYNDPSFENVFVIGHGIGTIAGYLKGKRVKVAELDDTIVELSRKFFRYCEDNVVIGDGREILENEAPHTYDYVVLDAFTGQGTPRHLTSREFFGIAADKLNDHGAIILNVFGRGGNDMRINAIHTTLREQFAYTKAFLLPAEHVRDVQNFILIGSNKPIGFQARQMAGFVERELDRGYVIEDI